jgi:hypothetical protein
VVEPNRVDCGDRRFGIRVCSEKHLACLRIHPAGLGQKLGPAHPGHPLVDKKERYRVISLLEPVNGLHPFGARARLDDPVLLAEVPFEVTLNCIAHLFFVVDGQDDGFGHFFMR